MTACDRLQRQLGAALGAALAGRDVALPEAGCLIWSWFVELSASRTYGMSGPNPLSWSEIEAWARLRRWPLSDSHITILRALDRAWLEHAYAGISGGQPPASAQRITPAAFDAVFGRSA